MTPEFVAAMVDWIVDKLRFLLWAAAAILTLAMVVGGAGMAYWGWSTNARIREVGSTGIETTAVIEAVGQAQWRSATFHALKLGLGLVAVGVVGIGLLFLIGRRRRRAEAMSSAA